MDRDLLNTLPVRQVANDTFALLNVIQDMKRESAIVAVFAAASLLATMEQVNPADIGNIAERIMRTAEGRRPEFAAARTFMEKWT